jgi:hypothetical protein
MLQVAVNPIPNQLVAVSLAGQFTRLNVYQLATGLYVDVYVDNVLLIAGVACRNVNRIVRDAYLGFIGDLIFLDTQGSSDPDYTGLGSRFLLLYLEAADL